MTVLVVAAVSARMMAEAAARDGFEVVALDLFGDADTRRAAFAFLPIGEPPSLHIDAARVLAALFDTPERNFYANEAIAGLGGLVLKTMSLVDLLFGV